MIFRRKIKILAAVLASCLLLAACTSSNDTPTAEYDFKHGNFARAFEKLWWPAHRCDPRAQYALGYMYYYGLGTLLDQDLARIWFRRSAAGGYLPAIRAYDKIMNTEHQQYVPVQSDIPLPTVKYKGFDARNKTSRISK